MKRIIDGKRYDTKTAELVAEWSNHYYRNDFHHCEETLYRAPRGAWFLVGEGGPLSKYAVPVGDNGRRAGEDLRPLSADEAREWLESHDFTDELEEYFAECVQDA